MLWGGGREKSLIVTKRELGQTKVASISWNKRLSLLTELLGFKCRKYWNRALQFVIEILKFRHSDLTDYTLIFAIQQIHQTIWIFKPLSVSKSFDLSPQKTTRNQTYTYMNDCKKTQGNISKTQLSANSEFVQNAEFCPKKACSIVWNVHIVLKAIKM